MTDSLSIAENIQEVHESIANACAKVNRSPDDITLVAVSKTKSPEMIAKAIGAGVTHFGENRLEEAQTKIPIVNQNSPSQLTWHMVGHIQSRKAKLVLPLFQWVHSIDSLKLARKLSALMTQENREIDVLLEVNISGESAKYGFEAYQWQQNQQVRETLWQEFDSMIQLPGIHIRGLMTMAPYVAEIEATRPVFAQTQALREALSTDFDLPLPEISMGMTNDYPIAIEEGATIVRIGRAIFGSR